MSQTGDITNLQPGDSISLRVEVDLPGIPTGSPKDITIEVFSADKNLEPVFHIYNPKVYSIGSQLLINGSAIPKPKIEFVFSQDKTTIVDFTTFDVGKVETGGQESGADLNKILIDFHAFAYPSSKLITGNTYHLISGVYFETDDMIFINEMSLNANFPEKTYDAAGNVIDPPAELKKGESKAIKLDLFITHPSSKFTLQVYSPKGFDDKFNIGKPKVVTGASFLPLVSTDWEYTPLYVDDEKHVGKFLLSYPLLMNKDSSRTVSLADNKMEVIIPVTAMLGDEAFGDQALAFGVLLDDTDVWAEMITIKIIDTIFTPSTTDPSASGVLLNELPITNGSSAVFQINITVPAGSAVDLNAIEAAGAPDVMPVSVRVVDRGACGMIHKSEITFSGNTLQAAFGVCTNVASDSTDFLINVAYKYTGNAVAEHTVNLKIGNAVVGGLTFNTTDTAASGSISAVGSSLGFVNNELFPDTELGMSVLFTIPPESGSLDMLAKSLPDINNGSTAMRLCKVDIVSVGFGLPCMSKPATSPIYSKALHDNLYDDSLSWDLGQTCPARISKSLSENTLKINLFYSLPFQSFSSAIPSVTPGFGIAAGDDFLFASISSKNVSLSNLTTLETGTTVPELSLTTPILKAYNAPIETIDIGGIRHIRHVMKTRPQTRALYKFEAIPFSDLNVGYICKMRVRKIGNNMPCATIPSGFVDKNYFERVNIDYKDKTSSIINLGLLTNWGQLPMQEDLYADENAVEIDVFFRYATLASNTANTFTGNVYWSDINKTSTEISYTLSDVVLPTVVNLDLNPMFATVFENDTLETAYSGVPKVLSLVLTVPQTFNGPVTVTFKNPGFSTNNYDFCDVRVTQVGLNMPCVDQKVQFEFSTNFEEVDGQPTFFESVTIVIDIQHHLTYQSPVENQVHIELTLKIPNKMTGSAVVEATVNTDDNTETVTQSFSIIEFTPPVQNINYKDFMILMESGEIISEVPGVIHTGEKVWVPFNISIPRFTTMPLEVVVLTPSVDGRAIITVEDVRFKHFPSNICCTGNVSIKHVYDTLLKASENITTYMQTDYLRIDFGYIINAHYALRTGLETPKDNEIVIEVLVQMTDHPLTADGSIHKVNLAAQSNDVIVVGDQSLTVARSLQRSSERALIHMNMTVVDVEKEYAAGDNVQMIGTISHSEFSRAEGHSVRIKLITPVWLTYDISKDQCLTNYTETAACDVVKEGNTTYFEFKNGVYYSSYININFSLSVDPFNKIIPGRGILNSAILSQVVCTQSSFELFPATNNTWLGCGPYTKANVKVVSPPCTSPITLDECSVTGSSALDKGHHPSNVATDTDSVWSPAIRPGIIWKNFLVFDFLTNMHLTGLELKLPTSNYGLPTKISIFSSSSGNFWKKEVDMLDIPASGVSTFQTPIKSRMTKILIEETDGTMPVGIKFVQWSGCPRPLTGLAKCSADTTPISDNAKQYRHFIFDPTTLFLYFCDINPYREKMACFSNKQGTSTFTSLPSYITYITGYSPTTGRTYFKVN